MERRFHSPYKYWVSGLISELAVLACFALVLALLAVVVAWVAG